MREKEEKKGDNNWEMPLHYESESGLQNLVIIFKKEPY